MSRRSVWLWACLIVLLTACAVNQPATVWDFNSNCVFSTGRGGFRGEEDTCGGDTMRICKEFEDMLSDKFASRSQCLAKCSELQSQLYQQHIMDGCRRNVERAFSLCGQFCLRNYQQ
jgi:hypothetical protein